MAKGGSKVRTWHHGRGFHDMFKYSRTHSHTLRRLQAHSKKSTPKSPAVLAEFKRHDLRGLPSGAIAEAIALEAELGPMHDLKTKEVISRRYTVEPEMTQKRGGEKGEMEPTGHMIIERTTDGFDNRGRPVWAVTTIRIREDRKIVPVTTRRTYYEEEPKPKTD